MRSLVLRSGLLVLPLLAAAAWTGCSDDAATGDAPAEDAGADVLAADDRAPPPPSDAGVDAAPKRDCAADLDKKGVPGHLDCTGLYADFAAKTIAADVKAYTPAAEFWSDGAVKRRFVYLPPGATIDDSNVDEWKLPKGTKLWKEFTVDGDLVETRLFVKTTDTRWEHATYHWNADATDAPRDDAGWKVARDGGAAYEVPKGDDCNTCHLGRLEPTLGFEAVSLGLPGAKGVTLASLAAAGALSPPPPVTSFTMPDDGTGKGAAAFTWLHANCGHCHNGNTNAAATFAVHMLVKASQLSPDGGVASGTDLDAYQARCHPSPLMDADAGTFYPYFTPGDPSNSAMAIQTGRRAPEGTDPTPLNQMPPMISHRVDTVGHQLLVDWISAVPGTCP